MSNRPASERNFFKTAYRKNLKPSLEAINSFLKERSLNINIAYVDTDSNSKEQYEADIRLLHTKDKKGIDFKITINEQLKNGGVKHLNSYGLNHALKIYDNEICYETDSQAIDQFECNFPKVPRILSGTLTNLHSTNKPYNNSYFRLCIQVNDGDIIYPASVVDAEDHLKFDIRHWDTQRSLIGIRFPSIKGMCVAVDVQGKRFHLYAVEDIKTVFIDSLEKMDFKLFKSFGSHIRLAFAFLSSRFYGGETVVVTSKDKNFNKITDVVYNVERDGIKGRQQLINPPELFKFYRNLGSSEKVQKRFKNSQKYFDREIFSHFCNLLHKNQVLRRAV